MKIRAKIGVAAALAAAVLLGVLPARAQVAVALSPVPRQVFWCAEAVGVVPCAGGTVTFFNAGTSVAGPVYTDSTGTILAANPVILDATGAASAWLTNQGYDVVLKDSSGVQQWKVLNANPYQILIAISSIILAPQTSDPAGQGATLIYRSDIPCLRVFTTGWDCVVTLTATQTLTNKTLTTPTITSPTITGTIGGNPTITAPTITSPTINGVTVTNTPGTYVTVANDPTTGTTLNTLTKLLSNVSPLAVISATNDTGGVIGITVSGAGKTGNATIQQSGIVNCIFDNSVTNGSYVVIGTGGDCHNQAQYPVTTQAIGRVLATGAPGSYPIILFGPEIQVPTGRVAIADLPTQNANISSTPLFTPSSAGMFRFTCFEVVTTAATTSSTLPQCNLVFTDADSSTSQSVNICATSSSNLVGQICGPGSNANVYTFFAKSGVSISWSTSGYASSGGTQMIYAVHVRLEGPI